MSNFLTKKQVKELEKKKWDMLPTKADTLWVEGDWDSKTNLLCLMEELFPELNLKQGNRYKFLICAYAEETNNE
tara:strand:- start:4388 stop:4609 length:222 start_codon:yes stop_codon:yes gene_type:complete